DPADRYPSAEALAEDLRCFLAGEPVAAQRPRFWQTAIRWAKRRPLLTVSACLCWALSSLGILGGAPAALSFACLHVYLLAHIFLGRRTRFTCWVTTALFLVGGLGSVWGRPPSTVVEVNEDTFFNPRIPAVWWLAAVWSPLVTSSFICAVARWCQW